jgi:predicted PolB exonuclease-like 3'-5' exonuclease
MATVEPRNDARDNGNGTAYLVIDTESVPDGRLLSLVKYPGENLSEEDAIARAQAEAREQSFRRSDFLPVTFQYPISVCVVRVGADLRLQDVRCIDAPQYRTRKIVEGFWSGMTRCSGAKLVTFNGRGFDLPLLELAAFRYGCPLPPHYRECRKRYHDFNLDLLEWLTNFGACRGGLPGGLNLLSKVLGKPGKMDVAGDQVYMMYRAGQIKEINDYCMADTLDTYFVFLRTRVLTGELTLEREAELVQSAKTWITSRVTELPALQKYLDSWGDWQPWP